jgi:hypothetical protein
MIHMSTMTHNQMSPGFLTGSPGKAVSVPGIPIKTPNMPPHVAPPWFNMIRADAMWIPVYGFEG